MSNLPEFLKTHKCDKTKNQTPTHTRIGSKEGDTEKVYGGSYYIVGEDLKEFQRLYYDWVFVKGNKEYLTEKQSENANCMAVDLDFRYPLTVDKRQHTNDDIDKLVVAYTEELKKRYIFNENTNFPVYVFEKPNINKQEKVVKDGIHIIFGIPVSFPVQLDIRKSMIDNLKQDEDFAHLPLINTWEDVLDEAISKGTTNWQLFGSRKPDNEAYKLVEKFEITYDITDGEIMQDRLGKNITNLTEFEKISVQYTEYPKYKYQPKYKVPTGNATKLKFVIANKLKVITQDPPCSENTDEESEDDEDKNDKDDNEDNDEENEKKCATIKKYVNAIIKINSKFFDDYNKWMLLGFICNNETNGGYSGLECFIELSKKFESQSGKKHRANDVKSQYDKTQKTRKKSEKVMTATLHKWLQEIDPTNEILLSFDNYRLTSGQMTASEIKNSQQYITYREEFEKVYFKLMTPVKYIRIIDDKKGKLIHFYTAKEFCELTRDEEDMPTFLVKGGIAPTPRKFTELWLDDEHKCKYSRLKFDPLETKDPKDAKRKDIDYNCFAGFINKDLSVLPMTDEDFNKTGLGKLFAHIFTENIVLEYFKCWLSHIIQKPNIKTKVAVVLFSKTHGIGKNTLVDYIIKILGKLLCGQVECIEDVTKNFNAHLCNKLLIYGDEISANAKKVSDRLKQIITRPSQNLEKKNIDAVEVDDFTNWLFTTNGENCFKIEDGDRRMFMVRCREEAQRIISVECYKEMEDSGLLKKMFSYFYHFEQNEESIKKYGKFNIGSDRVIDTQYKLDLLFENKPAYIQAFYKEPETFAEKQIKATELYELTQQFAKKKYLSSNYTNTEFGTAISKIFSEKNGIKKRGNTGIKYVFPTKTELLKILFTNDEKYYRYVNQLPDDFTPEFNPAKKVQTTNGFGNTYMSVIEED